MKKIALYGKGGIGKSTIASNLSVALSKNYKVMQIGCDPKADSTRNLLGGKAIPTVISQIKEKGDNLKLCDIVFKGYSNVLCVEAGGPSPGIGCAGLGIISAFDKLDELDAYKIFEPDIVLYDVLGDVVCGGFAMPMRKGYAEHVFIVTSGEAMALFAARNIALAVKNYNERGYAKYSGIILNKRNIKDEYSLVQALADETESKIIQSIRHSPLVQKAEDAQKTVMEVFPTSDVAGDYKLLAKKIVTDCNISQPKKVMVNV